MFEEIAIGLAFLSIVVLIWALSKISNLSKTVDEIKSKLNIMSAPAETLTQVTTAIQGNIGDLTQSMGLMNQSITDITKQATKIETLGKKYEETEALTRRIYNISIGSYEKGQSGENYLRQTLNDLMKIGIVRQNVPIGSKRVEYCVVFNDGKLLPIDSKVVATRDVEAYFDENTSDDQRTDLRRKIVNRLRNKMEELCKYIDPQTTLPCAMMAIPNSIVDLSAEIVPEAVKRNVIVAGYSAIPQLIVYFVRIHGFYAIQQDVAELKDRLMTVQQNLTKLDDRFFARFDRGIKMITNATLIIRQTLSNINGVLSLEVNNMQELPDET